MYVRSKTRSIKLMGKILQKGDAVSITAEQMKKYKHLVESGDLEVLGKHPDEAKRSASKKRQPRKQRELKSTKTDG